MVIDLDSLFPKKDIRDDLYGALNLGWILAKSKANCVLIGQCLEVEEVDQELRNLFIVLLV